MNNQQRLKFFDQHAFKVKSILDLASVASTDEGRSQDMLSDLVDMGQKDLPEVTHLLWKVCFDDITNKGGDLDFISEVLIENKLLGYLLEVNTPVFQYKQDMIGCYYTWGSTYYTYVYGDTYDAALKAAADWAEAKHAYDKTKVTPLQVNPDDDIDD